MERNTIQGLAGSDYRYSTKDDYKRKISLIMPKTMWENVYDISVKNERSMSQQIRTMIQMYLQQYYDWEKKNKRR